MTSFNGPAAVNVYRLSALGVTLNSYARQIAGGGIVMKFRHCSPAQAIKLAKAEGYIGKARDYAAASAFIKAKAHAQAATLPPDAIV